MKTPNDNQRKLALQLTVGKWIEQGSPIGDLRHAAHQLHVGETASMVGLPVKVEAKIIRDQIIGHLDTRRRKAVNAGATSRSLTRWAKRYS